MDPGRARRHYVTAHELGQSVYRSEGTRGRRTSREEDRRRGLQVHARLQVAHVGHRAAVERGPSWGLIAAGAFLLLVLGVALWIR